MRCLPVCLLLVSAFARAQTLTTPPNPALPPTTPSAAEIAFREGWWAEAGQDDLATALSRYLAAATADGPAAIRARALLNAGVAQQRLGKAESAIATLRQLLKEHPGQADVVEQARVHLRELTAIDLRQNYDEWFERRLFSEEVQLEILGKIEALTPLLLQPSRQSPDDENRRHDQLRTLRREILTYGKGAVPPLRKFAVGKNGLLADQAITLLFELEELPPLAALWRQDAWSRDVDAWRALLARRPADGTSLPEPTQPHHHLLLAALRGSAELIATVATMPGNPDDHPPCVAQAMLFAGGDWCDAVLRAMADPEFPVRMRRICEFAVVEAAPALTTAGWLALSRDTTSFQLRTEGLRRAAAILGRDDGEALDELLARLAAAGGEARRELLGAFTQAIAGHAALEQLPWTMSRLRGFLQLAARNDSSEFSRQILGTLRQHPPTRRLLAELLLADAGALLAPPEPQADVPAGILPELMSLGDLDQLTAQEVAARWHQDLATALAAGWPQWNELQRTAAIQMATVCVHSDLSGYEPVRMFCRQQAPDAPPALRAAIDAALEKMPGDS